MSEKIITTKKVQDILSAIENVPDWWAEIPLEDLPVFANFNRKLVVSGFNFPDLTEENDKRAEIFIRQIYTDKESGEVFVNKRQGAIVILSHFKTPLRVDNTSDLIQADRITDSEIEGESPVKDKVKLYVNQLDYIKKNLSGKTEHLTFILEGILKDYALENSSSLDKF